MACFWYIIVNTLHKGDNKDKDNDDDDDDTIQCHFTSPAGAHAIFLY
jgi:hypothetical protein